MRKIVAAFALALASPAVAEDSGWITTTIRNPQVAEDYSLKLQRSLPGLTIAMTTSTLVDGHLRIDLGDCYFNEMSTSSFSRVPGKDAVDYAAGELADRLQGTPDCGTAAVRDPAIVASFRKAYDEVLRTFDAERPDVIAPAETIDHGGWTISDAPEDPRALDYPKRIMLATRTLGSLALKYKLDFFMGFNPSQAFGEFRAEAGDCIYTLTVRGGDGTLDAATQADIAKAPEEVEAKLASCGTSGPVVLADDITLIAREMHRRAAARMAAWKDRETAARAFADARNAK